ncbi:MAG: MATE family efflux transporter [Planctomycetota bacterium]|nr:MATE family efflux transporter [Planctomycetota bacterium]
MDDRPHKLTYALEARERPLRELLLLAVPTVAQMASYTLMQFADRWMLAYVGDLQATAAGTAGIVYFCVIGFGFGVLLVVNTFASQSFGRCDYRSAGRYLWQGLWFGVAFGLAAMLLYPVAQSLFLKMGHPLPVATLEADYLRVLTLAGSLKLASTALSQFLMGIHRPMVVFLAAASGVVINLFFNWIFIYGHWGFPAMGVAGAAWGTNAAVLVELLVMAAYVAAPAMVRTFNTLDWKLRWDMQRTLLRVGLPAGFQLICDVAAWTVFLNIIMVSFGTAALSANSFAFTYMHMSFMPAIGVGAAVTALVGKYIGMKRYDLAERRAHLGFFVCAIYMVVCGAMFFLFRNDLIRLFSNDPQVLRIGAVTMIFVAAYQIFDAMFIVYVGALRGAGDTLVPAAVQAVLVWTIVVGGGFATTRYAPQYGVSGPWTLATLFGALLGFYLLLRFKRGRWKSIRLHPDEPIPTAQLAADSITASNSLQATD